MNRFTKHVVATTVLVSLLFVRLVAQQTALTDAQLKSADIEVPG